MRICDYCERRHYAKGMCATHYDAFLKRKIRGAETDFSKNPLKKKRKDANKKCLYCDHKVKAKGLCIRHYCRLQERKKRGLSQDLTIRFTPEKGKAKRQKKYNTITVYDHPNMSRYKNSICKRGRILEHIYIMSQHLGRPLRKGETVHHKNGDGLDNRIENLELWNKAQPSGQRVEDRIKWYIEFLNQYGYIVKKSKDTDVQIDVKIRNKDK